MVIIDQVTKVYPAVVPVYALKEVSLKIPDGDFMALAGPSGSGKTTLLNLIGGLDTPSSGSIEIDGDKIHRLSMSKLSRIRLRKIGFVFQSYNLIPVLTALENVEFVLLLQGMGLQKRRQLALSILQEVGLRGYEHTIPTRMSGGQQQRVAVARAIVSEPAIVLADEPTANLDSSTAAGLLDMMIELNEQKKITFVFSTHDPLVMAKASRVVHLRDGMIA
ncbi:MAG: ABC transporter ATP-binding protein [Chlamydiota bacterium]|nr:ABC transporter ATP-binding protein [Chlamydiota bacterium]